MAKLINVSLVVTLSVVVHALMLISVSGARDIEYDNSPAEEPWVNPFPKQCRVIRPCADFVGNLIVTRNMPTHRDIACCQEIIQSTKYCWEKLMEIFEEDSFPRLHPWAENVWDRCDSLANSPAQAPSIADSPEPQAFTFPEQCIISGASSQILDQLIETKTLPSKKDVAFCKEIVKTTEMCWEKTMDLLENPNLNPQPFTNLHPWAENTWNACVSIAK